MNWIEKHSHVLIAVVSGIGVTAGAIAANTTGLLPNSVGAWLSATAVIIASVLGHAVLPTAVHKLAVRFKGR